MPPDQSVIAVKIIAGTNPVTVAAQGSDAFNQPGGAATLTLKLLNQGVSLQYKASLAVWYVLGDDLPLGQLAIKPLTTDALYFVSRSASASDSNDGLSLGSAKATIAGALSALGASAGTIQLAAGTWTISAADGNGNAATLVLLQKIRGAGRYLTFITIATSVTWGILCSAAGCEVSDLTVQCGAGGTCTYGLGVDVPNTSAGSAESCLFERINVGSGSGTMANGVAVGPLSSAYNVDIAETHFWRVYVSGVTNAGFLLGNGTAANILNTYMHGCGTDSNLYGVYANSTNFIWSGGTVQKNGTDFCFAGQPTSEVSSRISALRTQGY